MRTSMKMKKKEFRLQVFILRMITITLKDLALILSDFQRGVLMQEGTTWQLKVSKV